MFLVQKYTEYRAAQAQHAKKKVTEKELFHLNTKIEKLLSKLEEHELEIARNEDEECVVCITAKANMTTYPCAHSVLCRKCFVKTIQMAVTERRLPLRCVICRAKILRLKQGNVPVSDSLYSVNSKASSASGASWTSTASSTPSITSASSTKSRTSVPASRISPSPSRISASTSSSKNSAPQQFVSVVPVSKRASPTSKSIFDLKNSASASKISSFASRSDSASKASTPTSTTHHKSEPFSSSTFRRVQMARLGYEPLRSVSPPPPTVPLHPPELPKSKTCGKRKGGGETIRKVQEARELAPQVSLKLSPAKGKAKLSQDFQREFRNGMIRTTTPTNTGIGGSGRIRSSRGLPVEEAWKDEGANKGPGLAQQGHQNGDSKLRNKGISVAEGSSS